MHAGNKGVPQPGVQQDLLPDVGPEALKSGPAREQLHGSGAVRRCGVVCGLHSRTKGALSQQFDLAEARPYSCPRSLILEEQEWEKYEQCLLKAPNSKARARAGGRRVLIVPHCHMQYLGTRYLFASTLLLEASAGTKSSLEGWLYAGAPTQRGKTNEVVLSMVRRSSRLLSLGRHCQVCRLVLGLVILLQALTLPRHSSVCCRTSPFSLTFHVRRRSAIS